MSSNQDFVIEKGVLTKYKGHGGDVVIPDGVVELAHSVFSDCTSLTSVTIPEGVTNIGLCTFASCTNLTRVTLPESVTRIWTKAFLDCKSLTDITLPAGLTSIGPGAFARCEKLTQLTIPAGVKKIESNAFAASGLTGAVIPEGITTIGAWTFSGCTNLTRVTLPESLKLIEYNAFEGCTKLTDITLPKGIKKIGDSAFSGCTKLTNITLPEGLEEIAWRAFSGCKKLTDVVIPEGIESIGLETFKNCASLTSVTIPASVTEIDSCAFEGCKSLTSIVVPKNVTKIKSHAFDGCKSLTSIVVPKNVTKIEGGAFADCKSLTDITILNPRAAAGTWWRTFANTPWLVNQGEFAMLNKILLRYQGSGGDVVIPAGVKVIGAGAFADCRELTSVTVPAGVKEIQGGAFENCRDLEKVTLPEGLEEIGMSAFSKCPKLTAIDLPGSIRKLDLPWNGDKRFPTLPEGLCQTTAKLGTGTVTQIERVWLAQMTEKDWAGLILFQTAKAFQDLCKKRPEGSAEKCLAHMLTLLEGCKKAAPYEQAAGYAVEHAKQVPFESIQALYELAAAKKFQKAADILKPLVAAQKKKPADGPLAFLEETFQEALLLKHCKEKKGVKLDTVLLADGTQAPQLAVLAAVVPYADLNEEKEVRFLPECDKAAALLDHESLMAALWENVRNLDSVAWILPYCRYASGKEIQSLLSESKAWDSWYSYGKKGRDAQSLLEYRAILLSDTREAMLYVDKCKTWSGTRLDIYAEMRGTDADTLRDTVLAEFGLDKDGKKVYDLGGNTVTVSLTPELALCLFDNNAGKAVKSIPKKGADPEKHEAAKADLAELKKNIKKVVKARCDLLFQRFLDGTDWKAGAWQAAYNGDNFLLRQTASLLVWSQDGKTFTLRGSAAIDSAEQPYVIGNQPIQVAHPMEMKPEDVSAWQKYFNNHGIKQPFAQVWEPVLRAKDAKKDRYSGIQIPAYRFKGQEKHGISFDFSYGVSELNISFAGCNLECDPYGKDGAVNRHWMDLNGMVALGAFTFKKYTRQVNHIVSLLDKWTIYGRILKDDVSVVSMLDSATLAQVMEYMNLAIDNGKTNVTAELLNYKNEHFPDFDPLAEFTLEDL